MFDLINGLPVHPLVVHAVVVLLPLAVLGTIAIAVRPGWRLSYGPFVVAAAAVATVLVPVSTSSGEALEERVGDPGSHAELGDQLIWFAVPLLVLALALVLLERRHVRDAARAGADRDRRHRLREHGGHRGPATGSESRATGSTARTVVAGLAVLVAIATGVQVYRVGDSGARAAWGDQVSSSSGSGD